MKEIKHWNNKVIRVQDKGSCYVILPNSDFGNKVQHQTDHSSFTELDIDNNTNFHKEVNSRISKWTFKGVIDNY